MEAMLQFIALWAVKFGKVHSTALANYRTQTSTDIVEASIVNGGKTLVLRKLTRMKAVNGKTGCSFYAWYGTRHVVSIKTGKLIVWRNFNNQKGKRSQPLSPSQVWWMGLHRAESFFGKGQSMVVNAFLKAHKIETIEKAFPFGNVAEKFLPEAVWQGRLLQAASPSEFWEMVGPRKLAKDEKAAIMRLMNVDFSHGMVVARIATRVLIPNVREIDRMDNDWAFVPNTTREIDTLVIGMRAIAPQRRLMMLQALLTPGYAWEARDVLGMAAWLRRGGHISRSHRFNARNIGEMHKVVTLADRDARRKLETMPLEHAWIESMDGLDCGRGISIVTPKTTADLVEWGSEQDNCIGSYGDEVRNYGYIIVGFARDGWVGHGLIKNRKMEQLLAKHNRHLDPEDKKMILDKLMAEKIIITREVQWG